MIKGILTDMDGTILNSKGELSEYTKLVLHKALNDGYKLAVASGRFFPNIHEIFSEFDEDIIYTCSNGSWIENASRTKVFYKNVFTDDEIKNIISEIKIRTDSGYLLCAPDHAITDYSCEYLENIFEKSNSELVLVDNLYEHKYEITKITVCILNNIESIAESLNTILGDDYSVVLSGDIWLDILKPSSSKANIFPILHKEHGILPEEMLVFGDYDNDIPMLELSPYSFAMADASDGAKKAAKFTIGKNDEHAVAKKIEELIFNCN